MSPSVSLQQCSCDGYSAFCDSLMGLKQVVTRALKNIIHKHTRMNLSSRFLFMKILKSVAALEELSSLESLKAQRFVKEKSYQKITQEVQKLLGESRGLSLGDPAARDYKCTVGNADPDEGFDNADKAQQGQEPNYYSDSSIIICSQTQFQEASSDCVVVTSNRNDEEELFNSLSDLRLDDSRRTAVSVNAEGANNTRAVDSLKGGCINSEMISAGSSPCSRKQAKRRRYIPGYRTAPYAILRVLHDHDGAHKHFIALKAVHHTDTALDSRQVFSVLKALARKGLVCAEKGSKYCLAQAGHELCSILFSGSPDPPAEDQEIKMVIDSREKKSGRDRVFFQSHFLSNRIPNETRFLSVGDFLWIKNERVLGHIVERKQCSDLASSIFDGRYREQKHRLSALGMCVYYLVENLRVEESREGYVHRCLLETRMEGFIVLETGSIRESAWVLEMIDKRVRSQARDPDAETQSGESSRHYMSYGSFLNETSKSNFKVGDMLLVALLGIKGLSKGFAAALSKKYLTLSNFRRHAANEAFRNEIKSLRVGGRELGERMARHIANMVK